MKGEGMRAKGLLKALAALMIGAGSGGAQADLRYNMPVGVTEVSRGVHDRVPLTGTHLDDQRRLPSVHGGRIDPLILGHARSAVAATQLEQVPVPKLLPRALLGGGHPTAAAHE